MEYVVFYVKWKGKKYWEKCLFCSSRREVREWLLKRVGDERVIDRLDRFVGLGWCMVRIGERVFWKEYFGVNLK